MTIKIEKGTRNGSQGFINQSKRLFHIGILVAKSTK